MQQWEYMHLKVINQYVIDNTGKRQGSEDAVLQRVGAQGWELVRGASSGANSYVLFLKRPKS
jgi:hypothetical protein